jgi:hypothetical protein
MQIIRKTSTKLLCGCAQTYQVTMSSYYDALLAALPLSLIGLAGGLYAVGVDLTVALTLGAVVATALTAHGLFVNDPASVTERHADPGYESAD